MLVVVVRFECPVSYEYPVVVWFECPVSGSWWWLGLSVL